MSDALARRILELEAERCAALVAGDYKRAIGELMSDDLVYTHASGHVENKAAFLRPRQTGDIVYEKVETEDVLVRLYHDTVAVVTGKLHTWLRLDGKPREVHHLFTSVWVRREAASDDWRITTYHTARLGEPH